MLVNLGNPVLYWTLKILLLATLFICGYLISYKDPKGVKFWKYSSWAILFYSLEMGLRWNRSWDYPHYYQDLTGELYTKYNDFTYLIWVDFFKFTGLPYWVAFIFYSAILIYAFLLLLQKYPKYAIWALPLFLIIPTQADNHVRQFFAMAFLLMAYRFYLDHDYKKTILAFFCTITIHVSGLFALLFFLLVEFVPFDRRIKKPWILIVTYILFYFYWDTSNLDAFARTIGKLNLGEDVSMQGYLDKADYWLTNDSNISEKLGVKVVASKSYFIVLTLFINSLIIYYGFYVCRNNNKLRLLYWSFIFILFWRIFGGNNEIFSRISNWFICFEPLLIGAIWVESKFTKKYKYIVLFSFIYMFYYVGFVTKIFTVSLTGYAYIWDK